MCGLNEKCTLTVSGIGTFGSRLVMLFGEVMGTYSLAGGNVPLGPGLEIIRPYPASQPLSQLPACERSGP